MTDRPDVRTLFLSHSATMGGAEFCLLDIASSMRDSAHVVLLEDGPFRERLQAERIPVHVVEAGAIHTVRRNSVMPGAGALLGLWRAASEVTKFAAGFDVVHANSQKALVVGSIAAVRARLPLVWHLHDIIEPPWFSRLNIEADVFLANHFVQRVLAVSRATSDAFVRQGGDRAKVNVVYNGIDTATFDTSGAQGARLRASLGLPDTGVVGCFSRLAEWKGQHVLLEAVAELPGVHVVVVGGPLFGEHAYEQRLRALVRDRGMTGRVHFLGQRGDVAALMHAVDLIVHPSTAPEPFARTLIEAMLAGRPPVASACGGVPELIDSGRTGYLFPPGDVAALRGILRRLLESPQEIAHVVTAAREHAQRHFALPGFVASVTGHLHAVASAPRAGRAPHRRREASA
jgi:glycosyltransferase involved in cell wall biosynthesis